MESIRIPVGWYFQGIITPSGYFGVLVIEIDSPWIGTDRLIPFKWLYFFQVWTGEKKQVYYLAQFIFLLTAIVSGGNRHLHHVPSKKLDFLHYMVPPGPFQMAVLPQLQGREQWSPFALFLCNQLPSKSISSDFPHDAPISWEST